jgi:hypothetical protein
MILVGKLEFKRPLEKPRHEWQSNIRMDLREIELNGMGWIHPSQDIEQ